MLLTGIKQLTSQLSSQNILPKAWPTMDCESTKLEMTHETLTVDEQKVC